MAIVFSCPRCDQRYSVPETMSGRRVTCKKCGQERTVPAASTPAPSVAPPPPLAPPRKAVQAFREEPPILEEDDDLDEPLDDFDELPASSVAAMPRPRPSYTAPVVKVAKPKTKRVRREVNDVPLPTLVTFGLGLLGLIFLVGVGVLVSDASSKGNPKAVEIGVAMVLMLASVGMMAYAVLKAVFYANESSGTLTALACFFIPLFLLGYVILNFHDLGRSLAWYAGGVVAMFLAALMLPPIAKNAALDMNDAGSAPMLMGGPGSDPETTVGLAVKGLQAKDQHDVFYEKLQTLLPAQGNRGISGQSPQDGVTPFVLWPVPDPKRFARTIPYAQSVKVNGKIISLTAVIPEADLDEHRREKEEAAKLAGVAEAANKAAFAPPAPVDKPPADPDNPFQEKTDEAAPAMTFNPNAGPIDKLLFQTRDKDGFKARDAIKALASGVPDDRKDEVATALVPLLNSDVFTRSETLQTLAALRSPAAVLALLDDERARGDAIKALGAMGDPRAAGAIAEHLEDGWPHATRALIELGPDAEEAVMAKLTDPNPRIRGRACEVLETIGGAATLKTMNSLPADDDGIVRMQAQKAMKEIVKRTRPVR